MAAPGLRIEIAPSGSILDVVAGNDLDWLDISCWVRLTDGISFGRGRTGDGSGTLSAGSLSFTMDNRTGAWTPGRETALQAVLETAAGGADLFAGRWPILAGDMSGVELRNMPIRVWGLSAGRSYGHVAGLYPTYSDWAADDPYYSGGDDEPRTYAETSTEFGTYLTWSLGEETYGESSTFPAALWTGVVKSVTTQWVNGMRPTVTVSASDPVTWAQRTILLNLPSQSALAAGSCRWLFPMSDTADPWADVIGADEDGRTTYPLQRRPIGTPDAEDADLKPANATGPGGDGKVAEWVGGWAGWGYNAVSVGTAMKGCGPWTRDGDSPGTTLHATVWAEATSPARTRGILHVEGSGGARVMLFLNSSNYPVVWVARGNRLESITAPDPILTATWTHIAVTLTPSTSGGLQATDAELWVDGVSAGTATLVAGMAELGSRKIIVGAEGSRMYPWEGRIAAVAGHAAVLSGTLIARIARARNGAAGDDAGRRASRLVWACSAPWDGYDAGLSTMSAQPIDGQSLADALQACADAERTQWWFDGEGRPKMRPRSWLWEANPAATVPATSLDAGLRWEADDDGRVTVARVKGPDGDETIRRHPDWQTLGTYEHAETLYLDSQPQIDAMADDLVTDAHAYPPPRCPSIAVDLVRANATVDVEALLSADIDTILAVSDPPAEGPAFDRLTITGITDRVDVDGWLRTFTVTPAPDQDLHPFRVGTSLLGGTDLLVL